MDLVRVPNVSIMDDETFRQHLELRHIPVGDFKDLKSFRSGQAFADNRSTYAAYHKHLHTLWEYDHEHAG